MRLLKHTFAIAEKELSLEMRFKINFIARFLEDPIINAVWFGVLYYGFFSFGATSIGSINQKTFVPHLVLGALVNSLLLSGLDGISRRFFNEKYWQTIQALLVAPVSKFALILGVGIAEFVRMSLVVTVMLSMAYIVIPTSMLVVFLTVAIILLLFVGVLGLGLMKGTVALSNENYLFLFHYLYWGIGGLACFYYPIDALPSFLRFFVNLNPIYHGVALIQGMWIQGISLNLFIIHMPWVVLFAVLTPMLAIQVFNTVWRRIGIQGY